jgi:hypothetical protein
MDLAELGKTVAKFAPTLGALLPVPGGAAIGAAIASAFGGDINKPEELAAKVQVDPQAAIKLAEIQANLQIGMRQAVSEDYKTEVADRNSARQRETSFISAGKRDYTASILAYIGVIGSFATIISILYLIKVNQMSNFEAGIAASVITFCVAIVTKIYEYHFGSSAGSRIKDEIISKLQ